LNKKNQEENKRKEEEDAKQSAQKELAQKRAAEKAAREQSSAKPINMLEQSLMMSNFESWGSSDLLDLKLKDNTQVVPVAETREEGEL